MVCAKTRKILEWEALVIQHLEPLSLYSEPVSLAVADVRRAKASEPEEGSERQKDPTSEVARRGR